MAIKTRLDLKNEKFCQSTDASLTLSGNTVVSTVGTIKYATGYDRGTYTDYTLVDKGYVDGIASAAGIQTANNGLTKSGTNVRLGGALTGNTCITGNYTLNVNGGAKLNSNCGLQISGTTVFRASPLSIYSLYLGHSSGTNTSAEHNFAAGYGSMTGVTAGGYNVGIGRNTLSKTTIGTQNIALGTDALRLNINGCDNIAQGWNSLYCNTSGSFNIGIGRDTLRTSSIGSNNIALGLSALCLNTSGNNNVAVGSCALDANNNGSNNIALGTNALGANSAGNYNIAIGYDAGVQSVGNNNIFIGIGAGSTETGSNKLYIATGSSKTLIHGDFITNEVTLPKLKLCETPVDGNGSTDKLLVWNSTDKNVKVVDGATVLTTAITGGTNGLTKVGQNLKLGGTLCENTTISLATRQLCFDGSYSDVSIIDACPTATTAGEIALNYISPSGVTSNQALVLLKYGQTCIGLRNTTTPFNSKVIDISWTGEMSVIDNTKNKGLVYAGDYSSNFTKHSLVDKNYVTGQTSSAGIQTANNGLTKSGSNVRLGGVLTGATSIWSTGSANLNLGAVGCLLGALTVCSTTVSMNPTENMTLNAGGTLGICPTGVMNIRGGSTLDICSVGALTINPTAAVTIAPTTAAGHVAITPAGNVNISPTGTLTLAGSTICVNQRANYNVDYSGSYTIRSLVDKGYVTGHTSGYINAANNGLTKSGQNVRLGGTLTGATTIAGASQALSFTGLGAYTRCGTSSLITTTTTNTICSSGHFTVCALSTACLSLCSALAGGVRITSPTSGAQYTADYSAGFVNESLVTKRYVTGITSTIITNFVCTANNGLTKTGTNVRLGGALTGNTSITGVHNLCLGTAAARVRSVEINGFNNIINATGATCLNGGCVRIIPTTNTTIQSGVISIGATGNNVQFGDVACYDGLKTFTNKYSLVDKNYVTGLTNTLGIQTADNGLTKTGVNVRLGGALVADTSITGTNCLCATTPFIATNVHHQVFNTNPTITPTTNGSLYYKDNSLNFVREIAGVVTQIGEEIVVKVSNGTGTVIANGTPVYVCAALTGLPRIAMSSAGTAAIAKNTIGLSTNAIGDNTTGYVTMRGIVNGVNTSTWAAGTKLYLSTTAGGLTSTAPTQPNFSVYIGTVLVQNATTGSILVDISDVTSYLQTSIFNTYTGNTNTIIGGLVTCVDFDTYTGNTQTCLNGITTITNVAVTGGTNGIGKTGRNVCLGGALAANTTISGTYSLKLGDLNGITLSAANTTDIGLNSKSNGGVYIKSQSGTVDTVTDFTNAIGIGIDFNAASGFVIYDNRAGVNRTGVVYAGDYSANYVNRSLVDKAYVDSVAAGLTAVASVHVASTGNNLSLSGLTNLDGIILTAGLRVLVKDQTNPALNGIYVASLGTWTRSDDYNFAPTGEISNGDLVPVLSGTSNASSIWVLTTLNPISSGNSLNFSKFSQQLGVTGGDGISVNQVGLNQRVCVNLTSNSGLKFTSTALGLEWNTFRTGLCCATGGFVDLRVNKCVVVGNEIPVAINTGGTNTLYVDSSTVATQLGTPIILSGNGLTKTGCTLHLGGALTKDTAINGSNIYDFSLNNLDSFNLGFDNGAIITDNHATKQGLRYAGDYEASFTDRSLVSKKYVCNAVGSGVTFNNGLTKSGTNVRWGGALTGDTAISYGSGRLCFINGTTTCVDIISNCSKVHVEPTSMYLESCTSGGAIGRVCLVNDGNVSVTSSIAGGVKITSPTSGAQYTADYSAGFVNESLVTKRYVTGLTTTSGIQTANNGLTKSGTNVRLGGTLTGDTAITGASQALSFTGLGAWTQCGTSSLICTSTTNDVRSTGNIGICSTGTVTLLSATAGGVRITSPTSGAQYTADYSAGFVPRSLVDKGYVTGITSTIIANFVCTANNGLTKSGTNVRLGGALTGATTITGAHALSFTGLGAWTQCGTSSLVCTSTTNDVRSTGNIGICAVSTACLLLSTALAGGVRITSPTSGAQYTADYSAGFVNESLVTKRYVDSVTSASGVQTANNGLTKSGSNVRLGGALTGDTAITGAFTLNINGGTKLSTGCGYQISGTTILRTPTTNLNSIYLGQNTGNNSSSNYNFGALWGALSGNTGTNNTAIGYQALGGATLTGSDNTAIGNGALKATTSGANNIAIGQRALIVNTTGGNNIALGLCSLDSNIGGNYNIAIGSTALQANTSGSNNNAFGFNALFSNSTGTNNIALGLGAGYSSTGSHNVYLGTCAGYNNTTSGKLYVATGVTRNLVYGDFATNVVTLPSLILCDTPTAGNASTDKILVWNSTSSALRTIDGATALSAAITGATNGLTKNGQVVELGGTLIKTTTVADAGNTMTFSGTGTHNICTGTINTVAGTASAYSLSCQIGTTHTMMVCNTGTLACSKIVLANDSSINICAKTNLCLWGTTTISACGGGAATYGTFVANSTNTQILSCTVTGGANSKVLLLPAGTACVYGSTGVNIETAATCNINLTGVVRVLTTPVDGTSADQVLVWNSTDKIVKKTNASMLGSVYAVTGVATNTQLTCAHQIVFVDTTTTPITITLPAAADTNVVNGKSYIIKNTGNGLTNNVVIDSGVGSTIDGSRCALINTDYGSLHLVRFCTSGSNSIWYSIGFIN